MVERAVANTKNHKQIFSFDGENEDNSWTGHAHEKHDNITGPYHVSFETAIVFHEQQLRISVDAKDRIDVSIVTWVKFIIVLEILKEPQSTRGNTLTSPRELGDRAREECAYSDLGNAFRNLGDFKRAIEYHIRHLTIAKEKGDKIEEGVAYCNLGNAYHSLGDYQQAEEYQKRHHRMAKDLGDRNGEGKAYCNLGNLYHSIGAYKQVEMFHRDHLSIAKELDDRIGEGNAYGNLGIVYNSLADFEQAVACHEKHLRIAKEMEDRTGEGRAYGNLGTMYSLLGKFEQAIECHELQLNFAKKVGDKVGEANACYSLGCDFECLGSFNKAKDYYQSSVKLNNATRTFLQSEDDWKISFRVLCHDTYTALLRVLLNLQEIEEALATAEQGRAQALLDLMNLQYGNTTEQSHDSFEPQLVISSILRNTDTRIVFIALQRKTINFWVLYKDNQIHHRHKALEDGCSHKDASSPLEYLIKNAFRENAISLRVNCDDRSLDKLRGCFSASKETSQVAESSTTSTNCTNKSLRCLYDTVIDPIADLLPGEEVVITPDGPLCLAPFSALICRPRVAALK